MFNIIGIKFTELSKVSLCYQSIENHIRKIFYPVIDIAIKIVLQTSQIDLDRLSLISSTSFGLLYR